MFVYEMTLYHGVNAYPQTIFASSEVEALEKGAASVGLSPHDYAYSIGRIRRCEAGELLGTA